MKIGVIGANGNLGSRVTKQALDCGYEVKAFVYQGQCPDQRAEYEDVNLFDLTKEQIQDLDVLISCFGGGFKADPIINQKAFEKYIDLLTNQKTKLITIAGAGSLYTDASHQQFEYASENHPEKLRGISKYIRLGVDLLQKDQSFPWIVVCPSRRFDLTGPFTGEYIIGNKEEIIFNKDGQSYVTYDDLAKAMVDLSSDDTYLHQVITIATKTIQRN